jgi:hypothetical protein
MAGDIKIATPDINQYLARIYVQRVTATGKVGTARDEDALSVRVGASVSFSAMGRHDLADEVAKFGIQHIAAGGGYSAVAQRAEAKIIQ